LQSLSLRNESRSGDCKISHCADRTTVSQLSTSGHILSCLVSGHLSLDQTTYFISSTLRHSISSVRETSEPAILRLLNFFILEVWVAFASLCCFEQLHPKLNTQVHPRRHNGEEEGQFLSTILITFFSFLFCWRCHPLLVLLMLVIGIPSVLYFASSTDVYLASKIPAS